jgi:hypothetical protein
MYRKVILGLALGFVTVLSVGCQVPKKNRFNPALSGEFFPLRPNSVWTYQIKSKSQRNNYVVTDRVVGEQYVPALNLTGEVVQEYYDVERGGTRPIVYIVKNGYLTRLSGLDYAKDVIQAPAWGRSEEGAFLPARLLPDLTWSSKIFPFGHTPGAFDIDQQHHSYFEGDEVVVPAGHFSGCILIETQAIYEGGTYAQMGQRLHLTYKDWYAPNVGLVKTVALQGGPAGSEMERVELLRFSITPKKGAKSASNSSLSHSGPTQEAAK